MLRKIIILILSLSIWITSAFAGNSYGKITYIVNINNNKVEVKEYIKNWKVYTAYLKYGKKWKKTKSKNLKEKYKNSIQNLEKYTCLIDNRKLKCKNLKKNKITKMSTKSLSIQTNWKLEVVKWTKNYNKEYAWLIEDLKNELKNSNYSIKQSTSYPWIYNINYLWKQIWQIWNFWTNKKLIITSNSSVDNRYILEHKLFDWKKPSLNELKNLFYELNTSTRKNRLEHLEVMKILSDELKWSKYKVNVLDNYPIASFKYWINYSDLKWKNSKQISNNISISDSWNIAIVWVWMKLAKNKIIIYPSTQEAQKYITSCTIFDKSKVKNNSLKTGFISRDKLTNCFIKLDSAKVEKRENNKEKAEEVISNLKNKLKWSKYSIRKNPSSPYGGSYTIYFNKEKVGHLHYYSWLKYDIYIRLVKLSNGIKSIKTKWNYSTAEKLLEWFTYLKSNIDKEKKEKQESDLEVKAFKSLVSSLEKSLVNTKYTIKSTDISASIYYNDKYVWNMGIIPKNIAWTNWKFSVYSFDSSLRSKTFNEIPSLNIVLSLFTKK